MTSLSRPGLAAMHPWLEPVNVCFVDAPSVGLLAEPIRRLGEAFGALGHSVQESPTNATDACISPAEFSVPVDWRDSLQLTVRRRFSLSHTPATYAVMFAQTREFQALFQHFADALGKDPIDPDDFKMSGLEPSAVSTLVEQGRRGGPMLSLMRVLQTQTKCVRLILLVGDETPAAAFSFDLVGGHPRVALHGGDTDAFYAEIATRIATAAGTSEVTAHAVDPHRISAEEWAASSVREEMKSAANELGRRAFFTDMIRVSDVVHIPAVDDAIARQYSEGCFATWDPALGALLTTITGSARPVDKSALTDDDLAVVSAVRPDRGGAIVRQVEGRENNRPSSEALELRDVDRDLPTVPLPDASGDALVPEVPVIRSKLHGHRGIASYDPKRVEFVRLPDAYYSYPVSCATEAQAAGIHAAFASAESLRSPDDPRTLAFTILPTHGLFVVEKWRSDRAAFEEILDAIDTEALVVTDYVPQGDHTFAPDSDGSRMVLVDDDAPIWQAPLADLGDDVV